MKKEFGKWLLDIAKYMVTALLLSSVFGGLEETIMYVIVCVLVVVLVVMGLYFVNDSESQSNKGKTNKTKRK